MLPNAATFAPNPKIYEYAYQYPPSTTFLGASAQEAQIQSKSLKTPEILCKSTHCRHTGRHMPFMGTEKAQVSLMCSAVFNGTTTSHETYLLWCPSFL